MGIWSGKRVGTAPYDTLKKRSLQYFNPNLNSHVPARQSDMSATIPWASTQMEIFLWKFYFHEYTVHEYAAENCYTHFSKYVVKT